MGFIKKLLAVCFCNCICKRQKRASGDRERSEENVPYEEISFMEKLPRISRAKAAVRLDVDPCVPIEPTLRDLMLIETAELQHGNNVNINVIGATNQETYDIYQIFDSPILPRARTKPRISRAKAAVRLDVDPCVPIEPTLRDFMLIEAAELQHGDKVNVVGATNQVMATFRCDVTAAAYDLVNDVTTTAQKVVRAKMNMLPTFIGRAANSGTERPKHSDPANSCLPSPATQLFHLHGEGDTVARRNNAGLHRQSSIGSCPDLKMLLPSALLPAFTSREASTSDLNSKYFGQGNRCLPLPAEQLFKLHISMETVAWQKAVSHHRLRRFRSFSDLTKILPSKTLPALNGRAVSTSVLSSKTF